MKYNMVHEHGYANTPLVYLALLLCLSGSWYAGILDLEIRKTWQGTWKYHKALAFPHNAG